MHTIDVIFIMEPGKLYLSYLMGHEIGPVFYVVA
jgi:hypothetical protein